MRLALLTAHYPPAEVPCGVGDYTRYLRAALVAAGHETLVITSVRSRATEPATFLLADRWGLTDLTRVVRVIRVHRPDAILLQYTPQHYGYGLAFKLLPFCLRWTDPAPLVVTTFHTLVGGRWISKAYAALLAAGSHGVVSTHAELTDLFRRRLPWWAGKLREIPIGANIPAPQRDRATARRDLRRRLGLGPEVVLLGTFGFPAPGKGFDTLIPALQSLNDSSEVHLVCVGETRDEDRPRRAHLEALAQRLGIDKRIHWLGGLSEQDVADTLSGADAYVVPYDDGASLRRGTLMAGFRIGLPIVTTTPRYPDSALHPGETILAVPPRSPAVLADCLRSLLNDRQLQERLRQAATRVGTRFDWRAIAGRYADLVHELQGRRA